MHTPFMIQNTFNKNAVETLHVKTVCGQMHFLQLSGKGILCHSEKNWLTLKSLDLVIHRKECREGGKRVIEK